MPASLSAFLTALVLTGVLGTLSFHMPDVVSVIAVFTAMGLAALPLFWTALPRSGDPMRQSVTTAARLFGWLVAPILDPSGHLLVAFPASVLWPPQVAITAPLFTADIWVWAARSFVIAAALEALRSVAAYLATRPKTPEQRPSPARADAAPVQRAPEGPSPIDREILSRLNAIQIALAALDRRVVAIDTWAAEFERRIMSMRATDQNHQQVEQPQTPLETEIEDHLELEEEAVEQVEDEPAVEPTSNLHTISILDSFRR